MKQTDIKIRPYTDKLGAFLGLGFANEEIQLLNWGNADNYCIIDQDLLLLMEVEVGQKHPTTNIIKIWPYLEQNKSLKIILVHLITDPSKISRNRLMLCHFIGQKMETEFDSRFRYAYQENDFTEISMIQIKKIIDDLRS